jgi:N-acetylmuramoyl-L-alanine amidase CwlA
MGYTFKTNTANKANYGGKRTTDKIKYIVIHYTAGDGDTDENNAKYFKNNVVKASAHYFVDDDSVTQSVPDDYAAWSVGGSKYADCKTTGGGSLYKKCTNSNSISIEICDDVKNGVVYPSAKTIENALELTRSLMKKYGIPKQNVIRHFDVVGKRCPAYWCGNSANNAKWLSEFHNKLDVAERTEKVSTYIPETDYSLKSFVMDVQRAIGAKVDGIAGKETLSKTVTVSAKINRTHSVVKAIQKRLNALGFNCGAVDGIAGQKFAAAVIAYQQSKKAVTDGEITAHHKTWQHLLGMI